MNIAQMISNGEKVRSGQEVQAQVAKILFLLHEENVISDFESEVNQPHKNFSYPRQYKCDFVITTNDDKYVLIRTSSSFRSDRVKIAFYDFLGIQKYSQYADNIVASILVFPDGEETNSSFLSMRNKVDNSEYFSPATHWLTYSELREFFYNYRYEVIASKDLSNDLQLADCLTSAEKGSYYGVAGFKFEKNLVGELNNHRNLIEYKDGSCHHKEYVLIMDYLIKHFQLNKSELVLIKATDSIVKLKKGGSPKTDLQVEIILAQKGSIFSNFSIKNSKAASVSCHDYRAEDFIRVIAPNDVEFKEVVETFQEAGSWRGYQQILMHKNQVLDTELILNGYMEKIIEWAITGQHDTDNLVEPQTQIVNFILTKDTRNGKLSIYSFPEYFDLIKNKIGSSLGAPFSWTYPSKQKGRRIQLKMPLNPK